MCTFTIYTLHLKNRNSTHFKMNIKGRDYKIPTTQINTKQAFTPETITLQICTNASYSDEFTCDWHAMGLKEQQPYIVQVTVMSTNISVSLGHISGLWILSDMFDSVIVQSSPFSESMMEKNQYGNYAILTRSRRVDDDGLALRGNRMHELGSGVIISGAPHRNTFRIAYMTCFNNSEVSTTTTFLNQEHFLISFSFSPLIEVN